MSAAAGMVPTANALLITVRLLIPFAIELSGHDSARVSVSLLANFSFGSTPSICRTMNPQVGAVDKIGRNHVFLRKGDLFAAGVLQGRTGCTICSARLKRHNESFFPLPCHERTSMSEPIAVRRWSQRSASCFAVLPDRKRFFDMPHLDGFVILPRNGGMLEDGDGYACPPLGYFDK
jgi:hypothetical protein